MAPCFSTAAYRAAEDVIRKLFEPKIVSLPAPETLKDAKTRLQEYLQSRGYSLPRYTVDRIEGEAHAQTFHVTCDVPDIGRRSQGQGLSRRRAEQEAAEQIILEIEGREGPRALPEAAARRYGRPWRRPRAPRQ